MFSEIKNQQIEKSVVVADVLNGQTIAMLQALYPLTEADFVRLKGSAPITVWVAGSIFSGVLGYAIGLGPKLQSMIAGDQLLMSTGEIKVIAVWSLISLVFYLIGKCFPNERTGVMKKISNHFKGAKSTTHITGGGK
jgi:hypothetical protein